MDAALTFLLVCARRRTLCGRGSGHPPGQHDERNSGGRPTLPVLAHVFDQDKYPTAGPLVAAAGAAHGTAHSSDHAHDFGLQRVLDGLGVLIDTHRA
ncbi:MAG: hypothetical protein ACJ72N_25135 [Labedaea sp.]